MQGCALYLLQQVWRLLPLTMGQPGPRELGMGGHALQAAALHIVNQQLQSIG